MATQPQQQQNKALVPEDNKLALSTINRVLEAKKAEIARAMPSTLRSIGVTEEKMIRVAMTLISNDAKLMKCEPLSIYVSVLQAAQVGLIPDGSLGQSYLVPFFNGKTRQLEAKLMIGYRGFIELATRSGKVSHVSAGVIHEHDYFEYEEGTSPHLKHRPTLDSKKRGGIIGAYAVAYMKESPEGPHPVRVMGIDDIEAIRKRSQAGADENGNPIGPWKTDWNEMAKKTCVRALAKYLNLSAEMVQAAVIDEYNEAGVTLDAADIAASGELPRPVSVPNITEAAGNGLREKIAAAKNGEAKPAAAAASSAPAAAAEEKLTDPHTIKLGENLFAIRGTVSKLFMPKADAPKPKVDVYMGAEKMSTFDAKFFPSLSNARGKMCILNYALSSDGKFKNIVNVQKVDETEFVDGLPAQQLDRGQNDGASSPKAAPVAQQESAAQPDDGPDPDDSDNFGR